jgi:ATP-dependent Clp endopeptidase proteolytic subunit ClpP
MAKRIRDNDFVWTWFDHNLDLETRTIYMGSLGYSYDGGETGVDHLMTEYFLKGMHLLETRSPEKEITIVMNNPGGDWYHGMAIYDAIKNSNCHCTIKVYGHAMSMGSIILQAADHRIMMPNSRFMIHYGYNGNSGHSKIFEKWSDEAKRINYQMENIYLDIMMEKEEQEGTGYMAKVLSSIMNKQRSLEHPKPTEISYKFSRGISSRREDIRVVLKELLNFDTILTPDETVALGLADEIFHTS